MSDACRSCSKPVLFARTTAGKTVPFEADSNGLWAIENGAARYLGAKSAPPAQLELGAVAALEPQRYTSHFATCPHADSWRSLP